MNSRTKKSSQAAIEAKTKGRFISAAKSPLNLMEEKAGKSLKLMEMGINVINGNSNSSDSNIKIYKWATRN